MYTSREDARSDLFLSGAWYVFGPIVLQILLALTRLDRIGALGPVLAVAQPIVFTVLVPLLLMRYRGESLADLGLGREDRSLGLGAVAAAPIIVGSVLAALLGRQAGTALPTGGESLVMVLADVLYWVGLLFLAFYGTVKARDAFGGDPIRLDDAVVRIGRFVGIAAAASIALIILSQFQALDGGQVLALLPFPIGVTIAVVLLVGGGRGATTTTLPAVLTAVVLMAIGPFALRFDLQVFIVGILNAALFAGIGLCVAAIAERTRGGAGALLLGLLIALGTRLATAAFL